jgi:hypothetical protein
MWCEFDLDQIHGGSPSSTQSAKSQLQDSFSVEGAMNQRRDNKSFFDEGRQKVLSESIKQPPFCLPLGFPPPLLELIDHELRYIRRQLATRAVSPSHLLSSPCTQPASGDAANPFEKVIPPSFDVIVLEAG